MDPSRPGDVDDRDAWEGAGVNDTQRYLAVGITLAVAIGGLGVSIAYLRGNLNEWRTTDYRVRFDDARGIQAGYQVRMAGIPIGSVQDVVLVGRRAELHLRLDDRHAVPDDSRFDIVTPLIGSTPYVQVVPGDSSRRLDPSRVLEGEAAPGLDSLMGKADSMMGKADSVVGSVQDLVGDRQVQADLRRTVHNLRLASDELPKTLQQIDSVIGSAATLSRQTTRLLPGLEKQVVRLANQTDQLLGEFRDLAKAATGVAKEADGLAGDLRGTVADNRGALKTLIESANETVASVAQLTGKLSETLSDDKLRTNIDQTVENVASVSRSMVSIAQKLDSTAEEVRKLAGDTTMREDIRQTVANIKETSNSVRDVADRIAKIRLPGEKREGAASTQPTGPPPARIEPGLTFGGRYDKKAERLRTDVHFVTSPNANGNYFRVGLNDATGGDRLDLQQGMWRSGTAVRYGLFAGKWGIGFDTPVLGWDLRLDAYDPNRATADLRLKKRMGTDMSVLFGLEAVGNGNRPTIGVQIKR